MEIYFYCSYEHSQRGFFMTRLEGDALVPAESEPGGVPEQVREFFSYDRFQFLWRDLCPGVEKPWKQPQCTGEFCGIRELHGMMASGRSGVINLAFLADEEEQTILRRTALTILGDFEAFRGRLFEWISVGGECGYELDGIAFRKWLRRCEANAHLYMLSDEEDTAAIRLLPYLKRIQAPRLERDTLRLAVCTCNWNEICETMGSRLNWYLKPRCAITVQEFEAAFVEHGPVWELRPEAEQPEEPEADTPRPETAAEDAEPEPEAATDRTERGEIQRNTDSGVAADEPWQNSDSS